MSGQPSDGGPAFPAPGPWTCAHCGRQNMAEPAPERLRDYFAGEALAGLATKGDFPSYESMAFNAYQAADAMLAHRAPKPEPAA